jgi:hypothetical protein
MRNEPSADSACPPKLLAAYTRGGCQRRSVAFDEAAKRLQKRLAKRDWPAATGQPRLVCRFDTTDVRNADLVDLRLGVERKGDTCLDVSRLQQRITV